MSELPKTFEPRAIEDRWYAHWESNGLFRPDRPDAAPWTIVMPPPNVTGSLHLGPAPPPRVRCRVDTRPRARHPAAARPHPPRAHARQGRFVGSRHRPRGHRDSD